MKSTPITAYDKRTFLVNGIEYRQVGTKPGFPILIEHRKLGSEQWEIAYGDGRHTQQAWDAVVANGKVVP